MPVTIIQMAAVGTGGTENAAANIDVPADGVLKGVQWAMSAGLDADADAIQVELSFIATNQANTNDARGVISSIRSRFEMVTSGAGITAVNFYFPTDLRMNGGERLYLHIIATAGVTSAVDALLHFEPDRGVTRRSERRRG